MGKRGTYELQRVCLLGGGAITGDKETDLLDKKVGFNNDNIITILHQKPLTYFKKNLRFFSVRGYFLTILCLRDQYLIILI